MKVAFPGGILTDLAGNKWDVADNPPSDSGLSRLNLAGTSAFVSTGVATAAAGTYTLAGATGKYTELDYLGIATAGFTGEGSSASVFVTVYDGNPSGTALGSVVISKNVNLDAVLSGLHATSATSGNGITITHSAGATGVTVSVTARKKFVHT